MSLLHIGGTEYEEENIGIQKRYQQPTVSTKTPYSACCLFKERESLIFVQCSNRECLSERR